MYVSISNPSLRCSWVTLSHVWLGVVTQHWCQTNRCSLFFLWLYSFFEKNVCRSLKTQFFNYVVWRFWDKAIQNFFIQSFQINLSMKSQKKICLWILWSQKTNHQWYLISLLHNKIDLFLESAKRFVWWDQIISFIFKHLVFNFFFIGF